jgi:MFS family permease
MSMGRRAKAFSSLAIRNYRIYFVSQLVSTSGAWMQNVAVGWLVLQLTDSGTVLGAVMAARYLPLVLIGPWGGLVADRYDRRRVLIATQVVPFVVSVALGALVLAERLTMLELWAGTLLLGLVGAFDAPVRQSFIPELVPTDRVVNAIALNSITINLARAIGPALAGLVIAGWGTEVCFFLNAATFLWALGCLLRLRVSELLEAERSPRGRGQIREGFVYILETPVLVSSLFMVLVVGALAWEFPTTLPLLATGTFDMGSRGYGLMLGLLGAGAVAGALFATGRVRTSVRSLGTASLLWGCAILATALAPTVWLCLALLVLVGVCSIGFNAQAKTILQLSADPRMRGRVMSVWSIAWQGSTLVGAPLVGWVGESIGARAALGIGGVAALLVGGFFAFPGGRPRPAPTKLTDTDAGHPAASIVD